MTTLDAQTSGVASGRDMTRLIVEIPSGDHMQGFALTSDSRSCSQCTPHIEMPQMAADEARKTLDALLIICLWRCAVFEPDWNVFEAVPGGMIRMR